MSCTLVAIPDAETLARLRAEAEAAREEAARAARARLEREQMLLQLLPMPPYVAPPGASTVVRPKPPTTTGSTEEAPSCWSFMQSTRFTDRCGNVHIILQYPAGSIPAGCPFPVSPSIPLGCR